MNANQLRSTFVEFFLERGHVAVPSASLVPNDPSLLFTIAGMVPFKRYFVGEDSPPWPRATSVQKCFRTVDIEVIGATNRHCTFFEMLGHFSFGDYFKAEAIPFAWEFVTGVLGVDPDRLWVTVHESDDEAAEIWTDAVGFPVGRLQRMGADNFWQMGETGPCGPCSEIYADLAPSADAGGGPAAGDPDRYLEIWTSVFMQYNRTADGSLVELPKKNIDTGAGLERILLVLQDKTSIFSTDLFAPMIEAAMRLSGKRLGSDRKTDVALRVMADHGRAMTMLISDGVLPSNEGRGYVLRRLVRKAVLAARRVGVETLVTPALAEATVAAMGEAYPKVREDLDFVQSVLEAEESGFDRTLRAGLSVLSEAFEAAKAKIASSGGHDGAVVPGEVAFRLHDTHGFPIELTEELAREEGLLVDREGFERAMDEQRERARRAARAPVLADELGYQKLLDANGPTPFVGWTADAYTIAARVVATFAGTEPGTAEIFLDRTPFYAEGGGQLGDTGSIVTETGRAEVYDTVAPLPGLIAHRARIVEGEIFPGQDAVATIDAGRREALRRSHTGTHLLHAALRTVLGDHVRQQGSLVAPDRLRFDFSHHGAPAPEELASVVRMANADVLSDEPVVTTETSLVEAQAMGAIAFFGERYGTTVRVVRAGQHSLELCGGTHVHALGEIGPIAIVSEGSIGANTRRIEAVTGAASLERSIQRDATMNQIAGVLRTEPDGVLEALDRLLERQRATERTIRVLREATLQSEAVELARGADRQVVVARRDGRNPEELRALAQAVRGREGIRAVVIAGASDGSKVAIAAATGGDPDAGSLVRQVAEVVGGRGGGSAEVAVAGGKDPSRLDAALEVARRVLLEAP